MAVPSVIDFMSDVGGGGSARQAVPDVRSRHADGAIDDAGSNRFECSDDVIDEPA